MRWLPQLRFEGEAKTKKAKGKRETEVGVVLKTILAGASLPPFFGKRPRWQREQHSLKEQRQDLTRPGSFEKCLQKKVPKDQQPASRANPPLPTPHPPRELRSSTPRPARELQPHARGEGPKRAVVVDRVYADAVETLVMVSQTRTERLVQSQGPQTTEDELESPRKDVLLVRRSSGGESNVRRANEVMSSSARTCR